MREVRAQRGRAPPKRPRGARPIHPFIRQNASFECALHTTRLHTTAHQSTQLHRSASLCIALHRKKTHERIFLLDGRSIPVELSPHSTAGQVESNTSTVRVASSTTTQRLLADCAAGEESRRDAAERQAFRALRVQRLIRYASRRSHSLHAHSTRGDYSYSQVTSDCSHWA